MNKYKDMVYSIRKDGRLMKRLKINGKTTYIYANNVQELYDSFVKERYGALNRFLY